MTMLERVLDSYIREMVNIDGMHFSFVPGRGTTDAIFVVRQLQKYTSLPTNFFILPLSTF